jgi:hypothetical protein
VTMNEGPRLSDVYKAEDLPCLSFSSNNDWGGSKALKCLWSTIRHFM